MPQIDCYLCEADVLEMADVFFAEGATITPDRDYSEREPLVVSTSENLQKFLQRADLSLLFVVSPKWRRSPLQIKSVMKGRREMFYVSQREGGPTLDIFYLGPRLVDGTVAIPVGFVSYHSRFWNPITHEMESAPRTLIDAYNAMIAPSTRCWHYCSKASKAHRNEEYIVVGLKAHRSQEARTRHTPHH
jgi:hypothetical protein